jgi:hypothetical protein
MMKKAIHSQLQPLMNDKASRMAGINVVADKRHKSQVGIRFPESGREFDFNNIPKSAEVFFMHNIGT